MIGHCISHNRTMKKLRGLGEVYRAEDSNLHLSTVVRITANVRGGTSGEK